VNASLLNSPLAKLLILAVFLGAIVLWLIWPHSIPPPDERNRIRHPEDGYSIIAPAGWTPSSETEEDTLNKANRGWLRADPPQTGYFPPSLVVTVLSDAPDVDKLKSKEHFEDGTFHDIPALIANAPEKKYWAYRVIFKDRDRWFEINLSTPDMNDITKSGWKPYVDSFRYEPEKQRKPVARASTAPLTFTTTSPATAP
jgi:hypothetical protein